MYQDKDDLQKVVTDVVRLSYCSLVTPRPPRRPGEEATYSATLLIPKHDTATVQSLLAAIQYVAQANSVQPPVMLHDGDGVRPNKRTPYDDECKGHWVLTASSRQKPQVVGKENLKADLPPNEIYSGMHGHVSVRFYYSKPNNRIGCGLNHVLKTKDDTPLAGNTSADADFADIPGVQTAPAYTQQGYAPPAYQQPAPQYQQPPVQQAAYPQQPPAPGYPGQPQMNVTINPLTGLPV